MKTRPRFDQPAGAEAVRTLGVCLGASTISVVQVAASTGGPGKTGRPRVVAHTSHAHNGNPGRALAQALAAVDLASFDAVAATGRRLRSRVNWPAIPEPEAVEYAYRFVKPPHTNCPAIVSAGGETFMVYALDRRGHIDHVTTGNKCASGTGEFFLQQLRRMDVSLEEAARWAATETPHPVSGRCAVFCKSDCTHATNQGVPRAQVTAGLCRMMAAKILELLKKIPRRDIMLVGGCAHNGMLIDYLRKMIPGLLVPAEAPHFEALGAALWALETRPSVAGVAKTPLALASATFDTLPALRSFADQVDFKTIETGSVRPGDVCILGLDVGSTTTKAVLLRTADNAMLASIYLRTNGDPVGASRRCYRAILTQVERQVPARRIDITGLGVCGSGRRIAGLHALTDGVINEISAHATAAVYFDPQVDTIFEIGGQDAKYTSLTNGVPADYAMNEACSAGTGSFLEESAHETLGVAMEAIATAALRGDHPPNFNDQCAAFIASDIKTAIQEGVPHDDIVAGLVYSICMNYANRVKGNRPVGRKVFMQGGVCYNPAVPLAMAALVGKPIVVPPEPGLMGAFGVALEIKKRLENGVLAAGRFDLAALADRPVAYGRSFTCRGGAEKCDRRCEIAVVAIDGRRYPFGGACNRYENLRRRVAVDTGSLDLVGRRQRLVFETHAAEGDGRRGRVAMNRSFLVNTYFPLYATFFAELGLRVVLPAEPSPAGIDRQNAPFCHPAQLAHGFFETLLDLEPPPEYIFLPHFKAVPAIQPADGAQVCPLVQGETFYLQATFREKLARLTRAGTRLLSPTFDLTTGLQAAATPLLEVARAMGVSRSEARRAFAKALARQTACQADMQRLGREALKTLERDPQRSAVVLFGRPYNAFAAEAHMGIPHKLASRGVLTIPFDCLPRSDDRTKRRMYWGMGQLLLNAARRVQTHPQLFGTFVTNFSCGPDSFVIGYFRDIMGRKPSLTLELDSHTADAGLETRVEAFLDIVTAFRRLTANRVPARMPKSFAAARTHLQNETACVITSAGERLALNDPRVTLLLPSMGRLSSEALAAAFRAEGLKAVAAPPADENVLKIGRANTACKECLPLILTTGTLLDYAHNRKRPEEVLVYFMPTAGGPCRFGQYVVFMEDLVRRQGLSDVAFLSLSAENAYGGLGRRFELRMWRAAVIADVFEDLRAMLLAAAVDPGAAMAAFEQAWRLTTASLEQGDYRETEAQLVRAAGSFGGIALKRPAAQVPRLLLTGEIFVRRDALSRRHLTERLAEKGFAVTCSPIAEWIHYSDFLALKDLCAQPLSTVEKLALKVKGRIMRRDEARIKSCLARSGLVRAEPFDIETAIANGTPYIAPQMTGEAILTVGSALTEIAQHVCGVIAIGPFGCMPNRVAESILNTAMDRTGKMMTAPTDATLAATLAHIETLPFLAVESDGSPFPQVIEAQLEAFCLRAQRLHDAMLAARAAKPAPVDSRVARWMNLLL